jgi:hypothetical protein
MSGDDIAELKDRLMVVPLPDSGGPFHLMAIENGKATKTDEFYDLMAWIKHIGNIKLLIIDPLQAFVGVDVNKDPSMAQFMWSAFSEICAACNLTIIVTHHMNKRGKGEKITTLDDARNAIRGTTALIDGCRLTYALWDSTEDDRREIEQLLDMKVKRQGVAKGGVVKTNDETDRNIHTYVRDPKSGVLVDRTEDIKMRQRKINEPSEKKDRRILEMINEAFENEQPLSLAPAKKRDAFYLPSVISQADIYTGKVVYAKAKNWLELGYISSDYTKEKRRGGLRVTDKGKKVYNLL